MDVSEAANICVTTVLEVKPQANQNLLTLTHLTGVLLFAAPLTTN